MLSPRRSSNATGTRALASSRQLLPGLRQPLRQLEVTPAVTRRQSAAASTTPASGGAASGGAASGGAASGGTPSGSAGEENDITIAAPRQGKGPARRASSSTRPTSNAEAKAEDTDDNGTPPLTTESGTEVNPRRGGASTSVSRRGRRVGKSKKRKEAPAGRRRASQGRHRSRSASKGRRHQRRDEDDGPPPLQSDSDDDDDGNDGFGGDETGEDPDYEYPSSSSSSSSSSDYGTRESTRRRTEPFGISPATAIGARDSSSDDDSVLGRFFSRPVQRGAQHAAPNARGAPPAGAASTSGGGSSASGGAGTSGFGRLPGSTSDPTRASVSISSAMSSEELWGSLRQVATKTVLCGLAGHLLPFVAPSWAMVKRLLLDTVPSRVHCLPLRRPVVLPRNPCGACQPAPPAPADSQVASGNSSEKGYIGAIATVVSGAFIGAERQFHSGGELPSATNNSVVAALRTIWPGTFPSEKDFPALLAKTLSPYRSTMHGAVRSGLCEHIIIPLIQDEASINIGAETAGDLVRGARTSILMMNPTDAQVNDRIDRFMDATFASAMKAHRAKDRAGLSISDVYGSNNVRGDFLATVALPLCLHAVAEIENAPVTESATEEAILSRAIRMARSWQQLQNGGFTARQQRAFQEAIWRHVLAFVTGPRRTARGLMQMNPTDITKADALRFLAPYSVQGAAGNSS